MSGWKSLALFGALVAAVYAASSGAMLLQPSPHFHFADMAWNLWHGRLDTDTPRRYAGQPAKPDDPPGYQAAIDRHLLGKDGKNLGWNDWASFRTLTLKGGQQVRGVFPWKDQPGERQHQFHTLGGQWMIIDPDKELKTGCKPGRPAERCDDVVHQVSFPPFPAVVMMPLVKIWGFHTNDVILTLLFAVASAVLFFSWLQRLAAQRLIETSRADQWWLASLFAFGSVAWYCSIRGQVWFTALVIGLTLHLLSVRFAQGARRPFWAGVFLGLGVATRTPLLFAAVFLPLEALFPHGRPVWLGGKSAIKAAAAQILWFCLPMAVVGAGLAYFNWLRWENPLEFGHLYLLEGTRAPTREHGLFNTVFLNGNLGAAITNMPRLFFNEPYVGITRHGLGLLASTPALFALFGSPKLPEGQSADADLVARRRGLQRNLLLALLAVAVPGLLYQNDGWQQFAYRFSMDFLPLLFGVFALRVQRLSWATKALIVIAIAVQAFGAITFGRAEQFYYD